MYSQKRLEGGKGVESKGVMRYMFEKEKKKLEGEKGELQNWEKKYNKNTITLKKKKKGKPARKKGFYCGNKKRKGNRSKKQSTRKKGSRGPPKKPHRILAEKENYTPGSPRGPGRKPRRESQKQRGKKTC